KQAICFSILCGVCWSDAQEGGPLEEEQHFYIQKLFSHYGQKDRLDFQGFQSLLMSLGLGEVKLVGVDHEDLGHDHVTHLDLLDVQEGLHSHSSSSDGHNHDHHNHDHHNHDHHSHDHHSHDHHSHDHHSHDHHDHKSRPPQTEQCLNLTQLLTDYGLHPDSVISPSEFTYLCPALLYQIDRRLCILTWSGDLLWGFIMWVWIWGFVSITIISLLSLLGVVLVPILKQSCFKFLLTFLVALAVGTLSGDALLHLLPHVSSARPENSRHPGLTALAGIYLLFIIEHCIGMFKHHRDKRVRWVGQSEPTIRTAHQNRLIPAVVSPQELRRQHQERNIGRKLSDHQLSRRSDAEWLNLKPLAEGENGVYKLYHIGQKARTGCTNFITAAKRQEQGVQTLSQRPK
uniref:Solute carrier family 39 member 10 n=1 Tax=Xiphophorus couchianus TaxID=32473 RepID=A0A3B5M7Y2_9TELE